MAESPEHLRRTGRIVIVCGLAAAALVYWIEARAAANADVLSAFQHTRSSDNQMGRMMGHFGLLVTDWQTWLSTPSAYAAGVAVLSLLFAAYFFRVASVTEEEMQHRDHR